MTSGTAGSHETSRRKWHARPAESAHPVDNSDRPVANSRALKPAISEPLSSVRVCLSFGGTARRQGMSAALKDAAVLSWTLASKRKRLLRSVQLSSAAFPPAAQTKSVSQSSKSGTLGNRLRALLRINAPRKNPFALAGPEFDPHLFGRAAAAERFIEVGNQISSERLIHGHGAASFAFLRVSAVEQDSRL